MPGFVRHIVGPARSRAPRATVIRLLSAGALAAAGFLRHQGQPGVPLWFSHDPVRPGGGAGRPEQRQADAEPERPACLNVFIGAARMRLVCATDPDAC